MRSPLPRFRIVRLTLALCFAGLLAAPIAEARDEALALTELALPGQAQPSITADPQGGFILTSIEREAAEARLSFHRLDRTGQVLASGEIARGSDWFVNWADFPSLVVADNGDWLSFVLRKSDPSRPYAYDIWTTRSTDQGQNWSDLQRLNDDELPTEHGFVSLLPDGDDRVLAVWLDGRRGATANSEPAGHTGHGEAHTSVRSAILRRDALPTPSVELDALSCDCCTTDALRTPDGPLVVYRDRTDTEIRDIAWLQRRNGDWSRPAIAVADHWRMPGCPVNGPALARLGNQPLLAWPTLNGANYELRLARRQDEDWQRLPTLEAHPNLLGRVDLAPWQAQTALVSWLGIAHPAGQPAQPVLRLAVLGPDGSPIEQHDIARLPVGRNTGMPRMASQDKVAILVWTEPTAQRPRVRGVRIDAR